MLKLPQKSKRSTLARRIFALGLLALSWSAAPAQTTVRVSGTVTDPGGAPVIGAAVTEEGTTRGITTDAEGKFSLEVSSPRASLTVTYLGMKTQVIALGGRTSLDITMEDDAIEVGGVVVTALGIKREAKALGYAVSSVSNDELTAGREQNLMSAMMGKVAGVDISTTASGPSGSTRVLIRGNSQLSGSNLPLYVVDGLPVDNSQLSDVGTYGGFDYGDILSTLNPDDIENITVLKGASASALYGSRASNGVIMITTKSARENKKLGIEVSSSVTVAKLLTSFDDYQRVYGMGREGSPPTSLLEAMDVSQLAWGGKLDPNLQTYIYNGEMRDYGNKNNNILSFFDTGVTLSNSVAVSNANDRSSFRLSVSDMRNWDIVPRSTMERNSISFRGSSRVNKFMTIDAQATYTMENVKNRPALSDAASNIGNSLIGLAPNFDQSWLADNYKDDYGEYYEWNGDQWRYNPYWVINEMRNSSKRNRLIGQARIEFDILPFLKYSIRGGIDTYSFRITEYSPVSTPRYLTGGLSETFRDITEANIETMLRFDKTYGDFDLNGMIGANIMKYRNEGLVTEATSHVITTKQTMNAFENKKSTYSLGRKEVWSWFMQVGGGYKGTYYLDLTLRNDISSTLPKKNRSYYYPSVSGSVIFSNLFEHGGWLSFGKLRGSWAMVGGDTSAYQLEQEYGIDAKQTLNGQGLGQVISNNISNKDLKPTDTYSYEVGLDMRFFNSRLSFDLTLYNQTTKNQIMQLPVSAATGYARAVINAGEIRNRGIELTLGGTPVDKKFKWNVTATFSVNDNKIVSLHPDIPNYELASARWSNGLIYAMENRPYGVIVGKKVLRAPNGQMLVTEDGMPQFENDVSILGNGNYKQIIGLSNTFSYKGFSLTTVLDARLGADLFSMSMMQSYYKGTSKKTLEGREEWYASEQARLAARVSEDSWIPTGGYLIDGVRLGPVQNGVQTYIDNDVYVDPQLYWEAYRDGSPEPFIVDASYIKLREISLSYNLPSRWVRKVAMDAVSVSIYGRNLWLIYSNVDNIDPESTYNNGNGKGFEYGSLPTRRTFGFGLNIKF